MNPFSLKVLTNPSSFCNRTQEIATLTSYAKSNSNAVIYSPRRFGKTSLVHQVQRKLSQDGFITIYVDLFGLSSADIIANRITKGVYSALHHQKNLLQKAVTIIKSHRPVIRPDETGVSITTEAVSPHLSGSELLDKTLAELGQLIAAGKKKINIVLDEFQEITEIRDPNIEGIMRSYIQEHKASYFFVGSRRRVLLEMFNQRRRPFFQSAINFKLDKLPHDELADFVAKRFEAAQKRCSERLADEIALTADDHPYYCQKLSFFCFELAGKTVKETDVQKAYTELIQAETPVFEAIVQGLAPRQIALLCAVAKEPSRSLLSMDYIKRHGLKSIGGIQAAVKKLARLDLIENGGKNKPWRVVDPIFGQWLGS
ncbi:MAG: ATP-binding protein [Desulfobacteraceae bacterium]|jgi:AAA+ ATPase superfamily predicted ATPase